MIDMKRPDGASPILLSHVRANKQTFIEEIEDAGFVLRDEIELLRQNYYLRFQRP